MILFDMRKYLLASMVEYMRFRKEVVNRDGLKKNSSTVFIVSVLVKFLY